MLVSQCPLCSHPNAPAAKVCEACGVGLVALCPACGTVNEVSASHCGDCQAVLPASDAQRIGNALRQAGRRAAGPAGPAAFDDTAFIPCRSADQAASRAFLVRFGSDGSVAVQPVPTLRSAAEPAARLLPALPRPQTATARARHWRIGAAAAGAVVAAGAAGAIGFAAARMWSPRVDGAPELATAQQPPLPAARAGAALALPAALPSPVASAPAALERGLAELRRAPPAAGPKAKMPALPPARAPTLLAKTERAAPRTLAQTPAKLATPALPARPTGPGASPESAAAVSAALARQRGADGSLPRPPARGAPSCSPTVTALGLCPPDAQR